MSNYAEVSEPILNGPFDPPEWYWYIQEGETPEKRAGRRPSVIFPPKDQRDTWTVDGKILQHSKTYPAGFELGIVNQIREKLEAWQRAGYPGVTRTTLELIEWWQRDGRGNRMFFAQIEAALTVIFLNEARQDFLQGIQIPRDEPSIERKAEGFSGFTRYATKMATGSGKTTVMGMIAAWSILNKVNNRGDARFSDTVLVVCPNVTIRSRLAELDPEKDEGSVYRVRDLVPRHLMPTLRQGKVLVTNWHVFEPQTPQAGGVSAKVIKAGVQKRIQEWIWIAQKKTVARGKRYMTLNSFEMERAQGKLRVIREEHEEDGSLKRVLVESVKYIESDTALLTRVLGLDIGGKKNILVMNDEAHHAYRIRRDEPDAIEDEEFEDEEDAEEFFQEATIWVDGLDKIHKQRGINFCLDLSATPYFLGRIGKEKNRPFPWIVSDFGLIDAIESGLVKIPQLAIRDTTGEEHPAYFNIWQWILTKLTTLERGGTKGSPKPEAILKYADHPIQMLAAYWESDMKEWKNKKDDPRPPVFILVVKNTKIAKVFYEWLAEGKGPTTIPPANIEGLRNREGHNYTIRVDSKVVHETDSGNSKSDEHTWMRFSLDTVGKQSWPTDPQGRELYPEGFAELAKKLDRPLHPPGRDVRCIISVGMLTEGWDCSTVTHIIGIRPFMSQLLCEQVVGRGLRRTNYEPDPATGKLTEEVSKILGVPFEVIPFKATATAQGTPRPKQHHIHALPARAEFAIQFPRVEGYTQQIRNRITMDWNNVPTLHLEPDKIPTEVEVKGLSVNNVGRLSLSGPGKLEGVDLDKWRAGQRTQKLVFDLATGLTRQYVKANPNETAPPHVLFPQLTRIIERYIKEHVQVHAPADIKDLALSPYYGWLVEVLAENIHPDASEGEAPEVPLFESNRGPGSTEDVDFWTSRDVREVTKSHLNYVVADTKKWEQSAAYFIDTHPRVHSFVKNSGLGFAIPYLHNDQMHDYIPDFIIRTIGEPGINLILETKGYDPLAEFKANAAERWVKAVNAQGGYGKWAYCMVRDPAQVREAIEKNAA